MRKIPIILTLFLTVAWGYTCWYWYTCNIKGFCDSDTNYSVSQKVRVSSQQGGSNTIQKGNIKTEVETEIKTDEDIVLNNKNKAPKLSAKDVLFDPLPKEVEQEDITQEEEITQSGSVTDDTNESAKVEKEEEKKEEKNIKTATICEQPLVGPIVLGGDNDTGEVEKLETFLLSRGENISIDGEYGNDDLEAVKRFQLKYKEDVLDPWEITTPTGYVGKTSIAKINEIACK